MKAAGEFGFFQKGKGTDGDVAGFAEDDVAGGDAGEIRRGTIVDQPANNDEAEEILA